LRFLQSHAVSEITFALITHLDEDHAAGMITLLDNFCRNGGRVRDLYYNDDRWGETPGYRSLIREFLDNTERLGIEIGDARVAHRRQKLQLLSANGITASLVYPKKRDVESCKNTPNEASAVIELCVLGHVVLLLADIEETGCARLLERGLVPNARVVKMPHHGDWTSKLGDIMAAAQPEFAVVSCGRPSRHDKTLPDPHMLAALAPYTKDGMRLLCTELGRACYPEVPNHVTEALRSTLPQENAFGRSGRHKSPPVPCAGTIYVRFLEGRVEVTPDARDRRALVAQHGGSPACEA